MPCAKLPLRRSLALRLIATFVAALIVGLGVLALGTAYLYSWRPEILVRYAQDKHAQLILSGLQRDHAGLPVALHLPENSQWIYRALQEEFAYRIVNPDGQVLLASDESVSAYTPDGAPFDAKRAILNVVLDGRLFHVQTIAVESSDAKYYVQVATSDRLLALSRANLVPPIARTILVMLALSFVAISLAVLVGVRRMLKPLRDASNAAAMISPRNLRQRLSVDNMPAELVPLTDAFNDVLARLEKGFMVQQEFLAITAHELKTPLALIRGEIEMAEGLASRDVLLRDVDQIARLVHQLLYLMELSEAQNYQFEQINPVAVAEEVIVYLARFAERHGVEIELVTYVEPSPQLADHSAMFVLVKNLLENAIIHSLGGSKVTVSVDASCLRVRDRGQGITAEHFSMLFTRFWRGPSRRHGEGAGLGLSICHEISLAHGWRLEAKNALPGAEFVVDFAHDKA